MKKEIVQNILKETEEGYDLISEKFSQTRKHFWGDLEFIKNYVKNGEKVLDFGCGNGRLTEILKDKNIDYTGVDISGELINLAQEKYKGKNVSFRKINPNQTSLAFKDNYFKAIYSIATFHHLPDSQRRIKIAKELYRVNKENGYIVITVWNLWQKKHIKKIGRNWWQKLRGKSKWDWNDCEISFTNNQGQIFNRYHHAFTKNDLKKLFKKAGFKIESVKKIGGNIVLIAKKVK